MMGRGMLKIMALANLLNFFMPISTAVDPSCDFYQELTLGQEYYIYNPGYPNYYSTASSCAWQAVAAVGARIVLSCNDVDLPSTPSCQGDRLSVSLTGDGNFQDARNYCGKGSFTLATEGNLLAVGLFTGSNTRGRFLCSLTSIQEEPPTTTTEGPGTCNCGWKQTTRIVGGHETGVNEFPLMAGLIDGVNRDLLCGASIISDRYGLTAAHCLLHRQPSQLALLVGDHNLTSGADTDAAALYVLINFYSHPGYDMTTQVNDIGVVRTRNLIAFSSRVGPVCLPFRYTATDFFAQIVTALGWGFLSFSGPKSDTLQEVDLSVISNGECGAEMTDNVITPNQICTFTPQKDTCLSDSGGPLVWQDPSTRRLQLVGIISYGLGCATNKPAINTRVTSYLTWIISVTSDAVYCIK